MKTLNFFIPVLPMASKKEPEKVNAFDWVPPDVTTELATDYMKALPENKLPIQGSAGAALRKQQLQKQLPLHDMDHKACDKLSEDEKQQFEKYLENLKKYVGQGRVSKVRWSQRFSKSSIQKISIIYFPFEFFHRSLELGHSVGL